MLKFSPSSEICQLLRFCRDDVFVAFERRNLFGDKNAGAGVASGRQESAEHARRFENAGEKSAGPPLPPPLENMLLMAERIPPVTPGKAYIVGENHPEVFVPRARPAASVPKIEAGPGGHQTVVHFHVHGVTDADSFQLADADLFPPALAARYGARA